MIILIIDNNDNKYTSSNNNNNNNNNDNDNDRGQDKRGFRRSAAISCNQRSRTNMDKLLQHVATYGSMCALTWTRLTRLSTSCLFRQDRHMDRHSEKHGSAPKKKCP